MLSRFKFLFSRLKYPGKLINSTISRFIATKVSEQPVSSPAAVSDSSDPIRVILPFKDQSSADIRDFKIGDYGLPTVGREAFGTGTRQRVLP